MTEVEVTAQRVQDRSIVTAVGEFDVYTAPQLRETLVDQIAGGSRHLVIDMTGVTFVDSSALGVLVGALKRVRADNGSVRLVCPNDQVYKVFRITGLTKVFSIHPTVDDAIKAAE